MVAEFIRSVGDGRRPVVTLESAGTTVSFIHNWPAPFNVGDYLCSPRHYFEFECHPSRANGIDHIAIVGGGAFNDLGVGVASEVGAQRNIIWGVGRSFPYSSATDRADVSTGIFNICGWRDRDITLPEGSLVPCVSVLNDIVEIPAGPQTGVFLNQNSAASGFDMGDKLGRHGVTITGTNALSEVALRERLAPVGQVVTNSYHIAYWSLLSGRSVALVGYSSKFSSLLDLFGLPPVVLGYERGNSAELARAVEKAISGQFYLRLDAPEQTRNLFRQMNIDFAERLVSERLFKGIRMLRDNPQRRRSRQEQIRQWYVV
ncbi:hypothetical protein [Mesorhizobium sp. B2-6-2]|uniref:hypothetical protein n=1 Tax=Mesorhizobium sp. B2-6-2 TaxID=2589915 RepID=UPI0011267511|nr:hypothetical protein [Mesorhizobium sp. B2-6-2]TPJ77789.1 hypothetical protein FJ419_15410 [Mesorhizobium sp. B2-6-2]